MRSDYGNTKRDVRIRLQDNCTELLQAAEFDDDKFFEDWNGNPYCEAKSSHWPGWPNEFGQHALKLYVRHHKPITDDFE